MDGQAGHAGARAPQAAQVRDRPGLADGARRRRTIPDRSHFFDVFAAGTRQNLASVRGRYRLYLARHLAQGHYQVDVAAFDGHGNEARAVARITVLPEL